MKQTINSQLWVIMTLFSLAACAADNSGKIVEFTKLKKKAGVYYLDAKPYNGVAVSYQKDGKTLQAKFTYVKGVREGEATMYHRNGKPAATAVLKNGKPHGFSTLWYPSGKKKMTINSENGTKHGLQVGWWENGKKKSEATYNKGKIEGISTEWWENGNKKSETTFKNGRADGLRTQWHQDGKLFQKYHVKPVTPPKKQ